MNEIIETTTHKLTIDYDTCYNIQDFLFTDSNEIFISNVQRYSRSYNNTIEFNQVDDIQELIDYYKNDDNEVYLVNAYIHGGIMLSLNEFNCKWDSGLGGILVLPKDYDAESYIREFNAILSGQVYYATLSEKTHCKACKSVSEEVIESLGHLVCYDSESLKDCIISEFNLPDELKEKLIAV